MSNRVAICLCCLAVLLLGSVGSAQADSATQLPFSNANGPWLLVDPGGGHVFVSGGPGTSSIVVLNFSGQIVKTITGEGGASQMALNTATHTLYVALHDATAISEINTQTLTETKRFSTAPYADPYSLVIAGGKVWFSCANGGSGCLASANLDGTGLAAGSIPEFSTSASLLAAGGSSNDLLALAVLDEEPVTVAVYDVSGSTPTLVSSTHDPSGGGGTGAVRDMKFDSTGAHLLLATAAPYSVYSVTTSNLLPNAQYPTGPYPHSLAVTGDGKFVAGGISTNNGADTFVYPVGSTTPVRTWQVGDDDLPNVAHALAFSPDASLLFAVSEDVATGHLAFHVLGQPTVALKPTTTTLTAAGKTVRYGSHVSLKVQVGGATTGKVDLYATTSSETKKLVASGSVSSGTATLTVTPTENTTYLAQLEQGQGFGSSTSAEVKVEVAPALSITTRPGGKARLHGHRVSRTWLTAKVKPARPEEPLGFVVQRHVKHRWRPVVAGEFPIEKTGTVHAFFLTNKAGACRVRVLYAGDPAYVGSTSGWKKFRVRASR